MSHLLSYPPKQQDPRTTKRCSVVHVGEFAFVACFGPPLIKYTAKDIMETFRGVLMRLYSQLDLGTECTSDQRRPSRVVTDAVQHSEPMLMQRFLDIHAEIFHYSRVLPHAWQSRNVLNVGLTTDGIHAAVACLLTTSTSTAAVACGGLRQLPKHRRLSGRMSSTLQWLHPFKQSLTQQACGKTLPKLNMIRSLQLSSATGITAARTGIASSEYGKVQPSGPVIMVDLPHDHKRSPPQLRLITAGLASATCDHRESLGCQRDDI